MSHFAQIDKNNEVIQVIRADQSFINSGIMGDKDKWIQTSYNGNIRKRYAGIGSIYNSELDIFLPKKIYKSWILDKVNGTWKAPIDEPEITEPGKLNAWNEDTLSWIQIDDELPKEG